jgi:hypothetical protein
LAEFGNNEVAASSGGGISNQILPLLGDPLVIILLLASLASAIAGEVINATIIVCIVGAGLTRDRPDFS